MTDGSKNDAKNEAKGDNKGDSKNEAKGDSKNKGKGTQFDWRHIEGWQKRRLFGSLAAVILVFGVFLAVTCHQLYQDKIAEDDYWNTYLCEVNPEMQAEVEARSVDATQVETAIYLEQVRSVDVKNSQFEVVLSVAYRWEGNPELDFSSNETIHFYKGSIKSHALQMDERTGSTNYQLIRYDVVINKQYWTPRFPLESHQLRVYLEPSDTVRDLVLVPVVDECSVNRSLGITGYTMTRFDIAQTIIEYDNPMLNPAYDSYERGSDTCKTEIMTQFEINRDGFGLYLKCFIALYGTATWILLCMYICTFRRVDPIGMVGAAFFGAVSNIMVGANLVPDALQMGLLEYGNLFGIAIIIAGTAVVITINTIRREKGNEGFAQFYGRIMLIAFIIIVVGGNIALPLSAYML